MNIEIFIVSCLKDREWLRHCLCSIEKFALGFSGVTLLVPRYDYGHFRALEFARSLTPAFRARVAIKTYDAPPTPERGYVAQMVAKMGADEYCGAADVICHVDSDCIFTEPVMAEDYFRYDKPELTVGEWSKVGAAIHWKAPNAAALGWECPWETMRRHPAVHWRGMYGAFRAHIQKLHHQSIEQYMAPFTMHDPRLPSEFNMMGGFALMTDWRSRYTVIDVGREGYPKSTRKLRQFWSWSPPDRPQADPSGGPPCIPIQIINALLYAPEPQTQTQNP